MNNIYNYNIMKLHKYWYDIPSTFYMYTYYTIIHNNTVCLLRIIFKKLIKITRFCNCYACNYNKYCILRLFYDCLNCICLIFREKLHMFGEILGKIFRIRLVLKRFLLNLGDFVNFAGMRKKYRHIGYKFLNFTQKSYIVTCNQSSHTTLNNTD